MSDTYEVHLENFEGPLDLLLYLIKKDDLDIYDIPIAKITQEYLATLDVMQELNLDLAGDFLVLAATLMQIKARALLPAPPEEQESGPDPRSELIEKLLEYQRFKGVAQVLEKRAESFKNVYYRGAPVFRDEEKTLDLSLFDLLDAVREALDRADVDTRVIEGEPFPIEEKMEKILFLVETRPYVTLREIFLEERRRRAILACFLALLELIKLGKVRARQSDLFGEVRIIKRLPDELLPPAAPATTTENGVSAASAPEAAPLAEAAATTAPSEEVRAPVEAASPALLAEVSPAAEPSAPLSVEPPAAAEKPREAFSFEVPMAAEAFVPEESAPAIQAEAVAPPVPEPLAAESAAAPAPAPVAATTTEPPSVEPAPPPSVPAPAVASNHGDAFTFDMPMMSAAAAAPAEPEPAPAKLPAAAFIEPQAQPVEAAVPEPPPIQEKAPVAAASAPEEDAADAVARLFGGMTIPEKSSNPEK